MMAFIRATTATLLVEGALDRQNLIVASDCASVKHSKLLSFLIRPSGSGKSTAFFANFAFGLNFLWMLFRIPRASALETSAKKH